MSTYSRLSLRRTVAAALIAATSLGTVVPAYAQWHGGPPHGGGGRGHGWGGGPHGGYDRGHRGGGGGNGGLVVGALVGLVAGAAIVGASQQQQSPPPPPPGAGYYQGGYPPQY